MNNPTDTVCILVKTKCHVARRNLTTRGSQSINYGDVDNYYRPIYGNKENLMEDSSYRPKPGIYEPSIANQHQMVELAADHSVYVYPEHIEIALRTGGSPPNGEKMARYLMGIFWTMRDLIGKTLASSRPHREQLNPQIVEAIIYFCVLNSEHTRGPIRKAINSKISSCTYKAQQKANRHYRPYALLEDKTDGT